MSNYRKPGQWRAYVALAYYAFRAQLRNPASFFFGFIFPVVFISIFGLIGNNPQQVKVGIPTESSLNNPIVQEIEKQNALKVVKASKADLNKQLSTGKIGGIVEVQPAGENRYTVGMTLSTGAPQEAGAVNSVVSHIVDTTNLRLANVSNPPVQLRQEQIEGRAPRYIDFAVPGQIGFALLSTAIFGTVFGLIYLKKTKILKRMFATPTRALTILLAQGTSRLITAMLQTVLILLVSVFIFKFYLPHGITTFIELLVLSALGLLAFLGFGYFIAGLSNDENAASPLSNLVTFPQFLLSGTFFPTDSLPNWLRPIAENTPLYYFNTAIRAVTTEGGTIADTWPYMLGLLAWGAVMYLLAARTFKWE